MNKKGLSPVIATVLLIALAVILASLVFLWANSLLKEKAQKFGEPADRSCSAIVFDAEISDSSLLIVNKGDVPLYGIDLQKKTESSVENVLSENKGIRIGESASLDLSETSLGAGDQIIVIPSILGATSQGTAPVICDEAKKEIVVN